jgi:spore coat protein U-like protein
MNFILKILTVTLLLFTATATYAAHCTILATSLNFGLYDVFSTTPLDSTGTISINCNNPEKKPLPVTVTVSAGASGSFSQRQMASTTPGAGALLYNLYSDSSRSQVVGDGAGGTVTFTDSINRTFPWNITLYGRIPARQNMIPGIYTDILTATVLW